MDCSETVELIDNPTAESELSIEIISDSDSLIGMESLWNRLLDEAGIDYPFLTHQWVRTWWECFGAGKKLHVLLVKDGDEVIAIAPLMLTRRKFYGLPLRCLEFIANVHTPRFDFIVTRRPAEAYRAIWASLTEQRRLWDVLLLCQVPSDSRTREEIARLAAQENLHYGQWCSAHSPYLTVQGTWENYFKQLHSKHRANVRRRLKRLSELGEVEMERISSEQPLESALEEGFRIEGAAWKDRNGTSIHAQPESRFFYTKLGQRFLRQGWLQLCFLTVGGRRVAFHYSLGYNNKVYLLKPGYDPEHAACSPVNLLCFLFLQKAFDNGLGEFDFLGVDDEWKLQWTRMTRSHYWVYVFSRAPLASLVHLAKFRLIPGLQQKRVYQVLRDRIVSLWRSARPAKETALSE
ncbi:MAG: GNAT family N-acetyltransferase [Acidobacteria bacterium]|nr:GNAT family N-acetyltransferase [Acidobacteriota bacterium]